MGFVLSDDLARKLIAADANNSEVVRPYLMGRELLSGDGTPERWVIDFQDRNVIEARSFVRPFMHVEQEVLASMQAIARKGNTKRNRVDDNHLVPRLSEWWKLRRSAKDAIDQLQGARRYVVCSRVTRRPIFVFMASTIRPGDKLSCFFFDDDYSFSILQSQAHWLWFITKCGKLVERFVYSPTSVFDTFPWPQDPSKKQIDTVAAAGREVRKVRESALKSMGGGLRAVYRSLELPGKHPLKDAHADLDAAVLDAYGFSAKDDLLRQLLELNKKVAGRIAAELPVTAPGVPPSYGDPKPLITDDCIRP